MKQIDVILFFHRFKHDMPVHPGFFFPKILAAVDDLASQGMKLFFRFFLPLVKDLVAPAMPATARKAYKCSDFDTKAVIMEAAE